MPICYKVNIYKVINDKDYGYREKIISTEYVRNYFLFAKNYDTGENYHILNDTTPDSIEEVIQDDELYEIDDIYNFYDDSYFEKAPCTERLVMTSSGIYTAVPKQLIGKKYIKKSELTEKNKGFIETNFDDIFHDDKKPRVFIKK